MSFFLLLFFGLLLFLIVSSFFSLRDGGGGEEVAMGVWGDFANGCFFGGGYRVESYGADYELFGVFIYGFGGMVCRW